MAETTNPHWIGEEAAWDVVLDDGTVHKDITQSALMAIARQQGAKENVHHYLLHGVVRKMHVNLYGRYFVDQKGGEDDGRVR